MVKNVEVELGCNKGWLKMHYVFLFQLVSMMLCNLPCRSKCVLLTNLRVFLVLFVREIQMEEAVRQIF
jgi:hypothetical protein